MKNRTIEIKWALIFTLMYLAWMLLEKATGLHDENLESHSLYTNLMAIPAFAIYLLALLNKKKKDYSGRMTYRQGFISGLVMTVIIALFGPFRQYITVTYLIPDYFANSIAHAVATGESTAEEAALYFNLKSYMLFTFLGDLFMGIVTSAIAAIFAKSKRM